MMKIDRLVRVTKKENSNGSSSTELEWEPGSKKEILKGAAAGAALLEPELAQLLVGL